MVITKHRDILEELSRFSNMDENSIEVSALKLPRAFTCSSTRNGGKRGVHSTFSLCKHITSVVPVTGSGFLVPAFFILAEKRMNSDLWAPL